VKLLAKNRRASYDYQVSDKLVAGLVLSGAEVKSIKQGHVSLKGSFVTINGGEAWLNNAHVTPYNMAGNRAGLDPARARKLLVHRKQLDEFIKAKQNGDQLIALALLEERNLVKLEVGIGKSKKLYDKRETIKRRTQEREADRQIKSR
jgi:SsrA-binding protein